MKLLNNSKVKSATVLIFGLFITTNASALSEGNTRSLALTCKSEQDSPVCQIYIEGLVDGYIASKKKYTGTDPAPNSEFLTRVYSSRVSDERLNSSKPEPACLPESVDRNDLVKHVKKQAATTNVSLDVVLYQELQKRYAC